VVDPDSVGGLREVRGVKRQPVEELAVVPVGRLDRDARGQLRGVGEVTADEDEIPDIVLCPRGPVRMRRVVCCRWLVMAPAGTSFWSPGD
jgi:hypothetical protein